MATGFTGGCMCGAVRYECSAEQASFAAICYCTDCQRESGSAFTANMVVPSASFKLIRGELRYYERIAESGNKVRRGFCADCGVSIINHPEMLNDMAAIRVGSLDDTSAFKPVVNLYLSSAPEWAPISQDLPSFERSSS
jgi:hypothetical protein